MAKTPEANPPEKQEETREQARKVGAQMDSKANAIIAWNMGIVQSGALRQARAEQEAE